MNTIQSGIPGLDDLFGPNKMFPRGLQILVSGPPGSGKTVFGLQFLINGALLADEPGIFVSFDDLPRHIRKDMNSFGWNIKQLEEFSPPLITMIDGFSARVGLTTEEKYTIRANLDSLLMVLTEVLEETGATRVCIDSLSTLSTIIKDPVQVRKEILTMGAVLGEQGCTTLLTAENSKWGIEEYSAQGLIRLNYDELSTGEFRRAILIQKMRGFAHDFSWKEFRITSEGIKIFSDRTIGRGHLK